MRTFYSLLIAVIFLTACSSGRVTNPSKESVEKQIRKYNRKHGDSLALQELVTSYNILQGKYLSEINSLKLQNAAHSWERIAGIYERLQDISISTLKNGELANLLTPADYSNEILNATQEAAALYYVKASDLLDQGDWENARKAYATFTKVKRLAPGYADVANKMNMAHDAGMLYIVIEPLRSEGLFFHSGNRFLNNRLAEQLSRDMSSSWSGAEWSRVYTAREYINTGKQPDWIAEPVWTSWKKSPARYNTSKRTIMKQKEIGKDSLNRPIYKTIRAELMVTELVVFAEGRIELRISNPNLNQSVARTNWCENVVWKDRYASYSGDGDALSSEDWNLVRRQRERVPSEDDMQLDVLQKIYPSMLQWLKQMAG